jgi:uncharacterized protein DUF1905/bacteriocin resistance YdeI/OmpD-like protein
VRQSFKAKLTAHGPGGSWTFVDVPFDCEEVFGTRSRVSVCGSINGFAFQNSLMPNGDGTHSMAVNKTLQAGAKARPGDTVSVIMELDKKKRVVELPSELRAVLKSNPAALKIYKSLSPSHQKEFAEWVGTAKQASTRVARAEKSLKMIRERAHTR